ncbi:hypothetical protein F4781DRAFT_380877 [Annulohypoxylon bovei var. microspora]|nr:hypothetical protein F4781DRAFT_380877 [Annulohypoxylon bovei var. microspora]
MEINWEDYVNKEHSDIELEAADLKDIEDDSIINTYVAESFMIYRDCGERYHRSDGLLWEDFKRDFRGWKATDFARLPRNLRTGIVNYLLHHGVYCKGRNNSESLATITNSNEFPSFPAVEAEALSNLAPDHFISNSNPHFMAMLDREIASIHNPQAQQDPVQAPPDPKPTALGPISRPPQVVQLQASRAVHTGDLSTTPVPVSTTPATPSPVSSPVSPVPIPLSAPVPLSTIPASIPKPHLHPAGSPKVYTPAPDTPATPVPGILLGSTLSTQQQDPLLSPQLYYKQPRKKKKKKKLPEQWQWQGSRVARIAKFLETLSIAYPGFFRPHT